MSGLFQTSVLSYFYGQPKHKQNHMLQFCQNLGPVGGCAWVHRRLQHSHLHSELIDILPPYVINLC